MLPVLPEPCHAPETGRAGIVIFVATIEHRCSQIKWLHLPKATLWANSIVLGEAFNFWFPEQCLIFFSIMSLSSQNKMPSLKTASDVFYLPGDQGVPWGSSPGPVPVCGCQVNYTVDSAFLHTEHYHCTSLEAQGHSYWFRICISSLGLFGVFFSEIYIF